AVVVRVRLARIGLAGIDAAVAVSILDPVGDAIAVGVAAQRIGAGGGFQAVGEAISVTVRVVRIRFARVDPAVPVGVLHAVGQAVAVRVRVQRIGGGGGIRIRNEEGRALRIGALGAAELHSVRDAVAVAVGLEGIGPAAA